ncbi:PD-(D/E)XK nuclease family protein [Vibrio breoganii]|uniref:PDDEXK-like family protein n=1 Tax=Vibrio breoganii TaxID=553239 RepID=UPI0014832948|nr:PD-(D/E)XK nuclease family protein [Vibrio breoganii]
MNIQQKLIKPKQLITLTQQYKKLLDKPDSYNLFSVLRSKSDEVRLHSRFLADLLNRNGKHGLNGTPQTLLLDNILKVNVLKGNYDFDVMVEHQNIDIFLVNRTTKQAIIIENKIYASDQEQQLLRYYLIAKDEGYKDITVVYLTLLGNSPNQCSVEGNLGNLNDFKQELLLLSYREDINLWIQSIIEKSAQLPALRESLIQYVEILRELTGMSNNREYIQELKKLLIDTDSVDVVDNIKEAHYELQLDSQVAFWKSLLSKSKLEFNPISDDSLKGDDCHINELVTRFMANRSGVNDIKIAAPLDKFEHCYLCVQIERDGLLFIGICNDPSEKNTALRNVLPIEGYECHMNYDWWPVYKYIHFDESWAFKNLRSEQIKNLHDKSYVDKFTDHIVREMKLLKSKLYE